jgi:hypothetical protein
MQQRGQYANQEQETTNSLCFEGRKTHGNRGTSMEDARDVDRVGRGHWVSLYSATDCRRNGTSRRSRRSTRRQREQRVPACPHVSARER